MKFLLSIIAALAISGCYFGAVPDPQGSNEIGYNADRNDPSNSTGDINAAGRNDGETGDGGY